MSIEDRMAIDERRKYLRKMQERHLRADRKGRGQLLDETETVTELHPKSLIRLMKGSLRRQPRRRQRCGRTLALGGYASRRDGLLLILDHLLCPKQLPLMNLRTLGRWSGCPRLRRETSA